MNIKCGLLERLKFMERSLVVHSTQAHPSRLPEITPLSTPCYATAYFGSVCLSLPDEMQLIDPRRWKRVKKTMPLNVIGRSTNYKPLSWRRQVVHRLTCPGEAAVRMSIITLSHEHRALDSHADLVLLHT